LSLAAGAVPSAADLAGLLDARGVLLFVLEDQNLTVADIWPAHPDAERLTLPIGFGVAGLVARNGKPIRLQSDSPRTELLRRVMGLETSHQAVARMCLPLLGLENRLVGVLAAHRSPHRPFSEADMAAAERFVPVLGLRLHAGQLWRAVHRHRTERDQLIRQAVSAQEAERRRIAFDLHDGVTTALASMSFHLSATDMTVSELAARADADDPVRAQSLERARAELVNARQLADLAYNQTRAAISGLHSLVLDDLGLVAAIESLVQAATRDDEGGPSIEVHVDPTVVTEDIPDHAAAALYRIAQETLANAVKHADAQRIVMSLRRVDDSIVFGCTDDGKGFDPQEARTARAADEVQHFGLSSIAERCAIIEASLRVESVPGRGTTILVDLPL